MPAGLTLDTDSEMEVSRIHLRHKLANDATTRNLRNRTIDVPYMASELKGKKNSNHYLNVTKVQSTRRAGSKKFSLPNAFHQDTSGGMSSKPTLNVENSEVQLAGLNDASLPKINRVY